MLADFLHTKDHINLSKIKKIHAANKRNMREERYGRYQEALELSLPLIRKIKKIQKKTENNGAVKVKDGWVCLGDEAFLSAEEKKILKKSVKQMMPWRKGPFDVCGVPIDAEWRSDFKWDRVKKACGSLQGKVVLDIGCNNGYYLYQLSRQNPKYMLGIDPVIPYYYQFLLLNGFNPLKNTDFLLMGVHDLDLLQKTFDVVFCMGILYHHPDPIHILRKIFQCLRPGGMLIVESLGISKPGSYFLFPQTRYMSMPGHWFIPTKKALENMVRRSGFQYVDTFFETPLVAKEQRKTDMCPVDGLEQGMMSGNNKKTIEGYDAPWRYYLKARRARVRR